MAGPGQEPTCAPLPAAGLLPDGALLRGPAWRLRGIEVEVAFQLGADLPPRPTPYARRSDVCHRVGAAGDRGRGDAAGRLARCRRPGAAGRSPESWCARDGPAAALRAGMV